MYDLFPLLLCALACGLLGAWLVQDAAARRVPALAWPGWCLVAVLPLVLVGVLAAALVPAAPAIRGGVIGAAGALLLLAAAGGTSALVRMRRSGGPARMGLLGPALLVPAVAAIALCFLLSVLLALSNGTLRF